MNLHNSFNVGNEKLYFQLKENFIKSKLPQSSIIYGDKGIGKSTFIKFFVVSLFNNFQDTKQSKFDSDHFSLINNNSHPNFIIISKQKDEKTKKIKNFITIDQIRSLKNFIHQSSILNLPKLILIDSADDLNINSGNSLLKILEEPSNNTFFFLISHRPSVLLPTIRSRCINYKFNKPDYEGFKTILLLNNNINNDDILFLNDLTNSSPGLALKFYIKDIKDIFDKIINIFKQKKTISDEINNLILSINLKDNDEFKSFILIIRFILTNIIKINLGLNINDQFKSNLVDKLIDLSHNLNSKTCLNILNYINDHEINLFNLNLDKKLFTLNLFSEIAENK